MTKRGCEPPIIPDHEVLRMIGRGAFGEVWLARTVTGVYRAVKVIRREDFDNERDFEREFEAIRRYEPISRQHPGLVNVLQVGRDQPGGFYYYVMEVADDLNTGETIDPGELRSAHLPVGDSGGEQSPARYRGGTGCAVGGGAPLPA